MKKLLITIVTVLALLSSVSVFAESTPNSQTTKYTITVNGQKLNTDNLPYQPYGSGDTVMLPLRMVSEALGYKVDWDARTNAVTVDDEYIQKAVLTEGSAEVEFIGRLTVIDMSRKVENTAEMVIYDGCTYVPAEFFKEFLNDVVIDGTSVSVSPSMCEID